MPEEQRTRVPGQQSRQEQRRARSTRPLIATCFRVKVLPSHFSPCRFCGHGMIELTMDNRASGHVYVCGRGHVQRTYSHLQIGRVSQSADADSGNPNAKAVERESTANPRMQTRDRPYSSQASFQNASQVQSLVRRIRTYHFLHQTLNAKPAPSDALAVGLLDA